MEADGEKLLAEAIIYLRKTIAVKEWGTVTVSVTVNGGIIKIVEMAETKTVKAQSLESATVPDPIPTRPASGFREQRLAARKGISSAPGQPV